MVLFSRFSNLLSAGMPPASRSSVLVQCSASAQSQAISTSVMGVCRVAADRANQRELGGVLGELIDDGGLRHAGHTPGPGVFLGEFLLLRPFLALGAAICAFGVLAGRKYGTCTDLRTNIGVTAVAESGGGKDHAPEVISHPNRQQSLPLDGSKFLTRSVARQPANSPRDRGNPGGGAFNNRAVSKFTMKLDRLR